MILAFLAASLVLAVTPGPAVIYLLTRTIAHGRRAGLASLAGVALGNLGNAVAASLGLAALFAVSTLAFTLVKFAGALYLVYLGLRALVAVQPLAAGARLTPQAPAASRVFRDGFLVALLNPKTALFFAAFLPQFMGPSSSPMMQSMLLGGLFVLVAAITDLVYVLIASRMAPRLIRPAGTASAAGQASAQPGRYGRYVTAVSFIGLGLYTALSGPRAAG